jgi:DNA replication protein DnaC
MGSRSEAHALRPIGDSLASIEAELQALEASLRARRSEAPVTAPARRSPWPARWDLEHLEVTAERRQMDHGAVVHAQIRPRPEWSGTCGACEGGYERYTDGEGYERVRPCGCARLRDLVERFNAAELPGLVATDRWLEPDAFDWTRPSEATVMVRSGDATVRTPLRDHLRTFVADFRPGRRGLALGGPVGTGKTRVVCLLAWTLIRRGFRVRFTDWLDYPERIKATFDAPGRTAADVRDSYRRAPVLIVDDLGRGTGREWGAEEFGKLIAPHLEDPDTTLVLTANYWPDGVPLPMSRDGQQPPVTLLSRRIGERSMSRIAAACDLAVLVGEDQRTRHLQAGGGR